MWAIAQQYNHETLGQAAPTIARLTPGQITDVVDTSVLTPFNTSGTITDSNGATFYTPLDIFSGTSEPTPQTNYLVTIWPLGAAGTLALAFGVDSTLTVEPGWDNVTGFGEPNGLPFIQAVGIRHSQILDAPAPAGASPKS
jgi:hypothetical protein